MESNLQAVYKGIKLQNSPMVMHVIVRNDSVFHTYYLYLFVFNSRKLSRFCNNPKKIPSIILTQPYFVAFEV